MNVRSSRREAWASAFLILALVLASVWQNRQLRAVQLEEEKALYAERLLARFLGALRDVVGDGDDLSRRATGGDDHVIGDLGERAHVEHRDVVGLELLESVDDHVQQAIFRHQRRGSPRSARH